MVITSILASALELYLNYGTNGQLIALIDLQSCIAVMSSLVIRPLMKADYRNRNQRAHDDHAKMRLWFGMPKDRNVIFWIHGAPFPVEMPLPCNGNLQVLYDTSM